MGDIISSEVCASEVFLPDGTNVDIMAHNTYNYDTRIKFFQKLVTFNIVLVCI